MQELVSIITPSYNCEAFIGACIESIQAQTYTNWELLITDDCSTDNSVELIESYVKTDARIKLFRLKKNSGAGVARNNSIREARGRYIAFCDSDDLWTPDKLEKQISFLIANNYKLTHTFTKVINDKDEVVGINKKPYRVSFKSTRILNYIGTSSVIYDTKGIGKFYMKPIRRRQDWALWLDILKVTKYAYCMEEPVSIYRYSPNSLSSNKFKLFKYHVAVYHESLGYSLLYSYFLFYCVSLPCIVYKKGLEKIKEKLFRKKYSQMGV